MTENVDVAAETTATTSEPSQGWDATASHASPDLGLDRTEFHFQTYRTAAAVKAIEAANRKLARAGVGERFTYTTVESHVTVLESGAQRTIRRSMTTLTLNHPQICIAGWEFVATLLHEDGAVIIRTVPGMTLNGAPVRLDRLCDHCHIQRSRKDTYLIRRIQDGQLKQVGSNCIAAFLGVRPAGLWAMTFDLEPAIGAAENASAAKGDLRVPVRDVLAYAWPSPTTAGPSSPAALPSGAASRPPTSSTKPSSEPGPPPTR